MPSRDYSKTLDRLATLLRRKPMTVQEIAKAMDCSKPVAHTRLEDLRKRGVALKRSRVPRLPPGERAPGPRPFVYVVS